MLSTSSSTKILKNNKSLFGIFVSSLRLLEKSYNITAPKGLRLYKREKLCSPTAIDRLFTGGRKKSVAMADPSPVVHSALVYPLKMTWTERFPVSRGGADIQFLISIPKKRLRHAVDRVAMRRRVREAYRLNRNDFVVDPAHPLDVAFIWVADGAVDTSRIKRSIRRLLERLPVKTE